MWALPIRPRLTMHMQDIPKQLDDSVYFIVARYRGSGYGCGAGGLTRCQRCAWRRSFVQRFNTLRYLPIDYLSRGYAPIV
jgi:hypothetical protein